MFLVRARTKVVLFVSEYNAISERRRDKSDEKNRNKFKYVISIQVGEEDICKNKMHRVLI